VKTFVWTIMILVSLIFWFSVFKLWTWIDWTWFEMIWHRAIPL